MKKNAQKNSLCTPSIVGIALKVTDSSHTINLDKDLTQKNLPAEKNRLTFDLFKWFSNEPDIQIRSPFFVPICFTSLDT